MCAYCSYKFKDVEDRSWMCFLFLILCIKERTVTLENNYFHKNWNTLTNCFSVFHNDLFENGNFVTGFFLSF